MSLFTLWIGKGYSKMWHIGFAIGLQFEKKCCIHNIFAGTIDFKGWNGFFKYLVYIVISVNDASYNMYDFV